MTNAYIMEKTLENLNKGKNIATVSITRTRGSTPRGVGTMMGILEDGTIYGTIGGGILEKHIIDLAKEAIEDGESRSVRLSLEQDELKMVCGGELDIFINIHKTRPKLLIVGGGHVAYAIYNIANLLDFNLVVFEDRRELLSTERFKGAQNLVLGDIVDELSNYTIDNNTYIVIVTRGHEYDQASLEAVLDRDAKYIGVMGSKKKVKKMLKALEEKGIGKDKLKNVYSPVGLKISDGTPEEIALSVMAEILAVKNNGELKHMKIE